MLREDRTEDLDALIEAEYVSLRRHFEERLAPLLIRRALRNAAEGLPPLVDAVPTPGPADDPEAPRARSPVARLVIKALQEAPGYRMYGQALSRIVLDAGFTLDSVEKAKTGLKKRGVLIKEHETGSWLLAPRFREPGVAVPTHCSTRRIEDPQDTPAGRAMLEALTAAGEDGLGGGELVKAAVSRGLPRSQAVAVQRSLRAAGRIRCDLGRGARWRIAGSQRADATGPLPGASGQN